MPESCAAWGCKNRRTVRTKNQGITFHKFPQQKALRRQWEAALRRRGFSASSSSVLCSAHFRPEDLDTTGQIVRVRAGVRPSVFCFSKSLQPPGADSGSSGTEDRDGQAVTVEAAPPSAAPAPPSPPSPPSAVPSVPPAVPSPPSAVPSAVPSPPSAVPPAVPCPPSAVPSPPSAVPSVPSPPPAVPSPPPAPPSPPVSTEAEPQSNVQDHSYALPESFSDLKTRLSEALSRVDSLEREMRNAKDRERRAKSMLHFLLAYLRRKNLLNEELKERFSFYSGKII